MMMMMMMMMQLQKTNSDTTIVDANDRQQMLLPKPLC